MTSARAQAYIGVCMGAVPSVGSRGKAYGGGLRERSPPPKLNYAYFYRKKPRLE